MSFKEDLKKNMQDMSDWTYNAIENWWHGGDKGSIEAWDKALKQLRRNANWFELIEGIADLEYKGGKVGVSEEKIEDLLGKGWTREEIQSELDKYHRIQDLREDALTFIWESYGSPYTKMMPKETNISHPNKKHLNRPWYKTAKDAITNWGSDPDTLGVYEHDALYGIVEELTHAAQMGLLSPEELKNYKKTIHYDKMTFPEWKYNMMKYETPGAFEHEAHEIIAPILWNFISETGLNAATQEGSELSEESKQQLLMDIDKALETVRTSQQHPHHTIYPSDLPFDQYDMEK